MDKLTENQRKILDETLQEMYVLHDLHDAICLIRTKLEKKEDED